MLPCQLDYKSWLVCLFRRCCPIAKIYSRKGRMREQGVRRVEREMDV
jgi:phage gp36-like protein